MTAIEKRRRLQPSGKETAVSYSVLALLALIAIGVGLRQSHFDPNLWRPIGFQSGARGGGLEAREPAADSPLAPFLIPEIEFLAGPENFSAATLSDKIDGKADLYLKAGFKALIAARLRLSADPALWFEILLFEMTDPDAAFAVYSQQKRSGALALDAIGQGYRAGNALFLASGNRYVEMIGAAASEPLLEVMVKAAQHFLGEAPSQAAATDPARLFPESGLIAGSLTLLAADAFGFDRFNQVYVAQYRSGAEELIAFVKDCGTPAAAAELVGAYAAFLENFGAAALPSGGPNGVSPSYRLFDSYETVFNVGRYLAGVHEGPSREANERLAAQLRNRLEDILR